MVHTEPIQGVREPFEGGVMAVSRLCERNTGLALSKKYTLAGLTIHSCESFIQEERNTVIYRRPASRAYCTNHLVKVLYQANWETQPNDRNTNCEKSVFQNQQVNRSNSILFILFYSLLFYVRFSNTFSLIFRTPILCFSDTKSDNFGHPLSEIS